MQMLIRRGRVAPKSQKWKAKRRVGEQGLGQSDAPLERKHHVGSEARLGKAWSVECCLVCSLWDGDLLEVVLTA